MHKYSRQIYWALIVALSLVVIVKAWAVFFSTSGSSMADESWFFTVSLTFQRFYNPALVMLVIIALLRRSGAALWVFGIVAVEDLFSFGLILGAVDFGSSNATLYMRIYLGIMFFIALCWSALRLLVKTKEISKP